MNSEELKSSVLASINELLTRLNDEAVAYRFLAASYESLKRRAAEDREKWFGVLQLAEMSMAAHPCDMPHCSCRELRQRFDREKAGMMFRSPEELKELEGGEQ